VAKKKTDLEKEEIKEEKWKSKLSHKFVMILAAVSILGFIAIVSETIFNKNINMHIHSLWLIVIGIGMIIETQIKTLLKLREQGLTPNNFTHLITLVIGVIAILAGIFSFPHFGIVNPSFHAVRGIVSIIAIIVIVVETWLVE